MKKPIRWILTAFALAALMAADAWITWALTVRGHDSTIQATASQTIVAIDPLDQFRLERDHLRARQEAQLNDIIYSDKSDAQTVARAQDQLLSLLSRAEQELTLEGLIQGRGFEDALVSVGERSASVLVRKDVVTQRESAVILDLVLRQTGLTGGNVKIIPVK